MFAIDIPGICRPLRGVAGRVRFVPLIILFLATYIISSCFVLPASADVGHKKHILVLNSYHKGLSWTDNIVKGIEYVFQAATNNVELSFEYMDTKRYYSASYFGKLHETYKLKYKNAHFDVIIACDNDAFNFVSKYRADGLVEIGRPGIGYSLENGNADIYHKGA